MDLPEFVGALGNVFENSPWIAQRAWKTRPFSTVEALHSAMVNEVQKASWRKQLVLLRAHPELGEKAETRHAVSAFSETEQSAAGLTTLSNRDRERIGALNKAYRAKFGFPFILAVRGYTVDAIISELERRILNDRAIELHRCLDQVFAISRKRLEVLICDIERSGTDDSLRLD